jgi:phage gpG-like protein
MALSMVYEVDGVTKVEHRLLGITARALEPRPILEGLADAMEGIERDLFDSEGSGRWAPLSPATLAKKGSSGILRDTDALMNSLTESGSGSVRHYFGSELVFGTSVTDEQGTDYPALLKSGTSKMPARDPLPTPNASQMRLFSKAVQSYLIGQDRAAFGASPFGIGITNVFGA